MTAETSAVSVGADRLKLACGELPDVIAVVPVPGVGLSISRKESNPFGFVAGISLPPRLTLKAYSPA